MKEYTLEQLRTMSQISMMGCDYMTFHRFIKRPLTFHDFVMQSLTQPHLPVQQYLQSRAEKEAEGRSDD